MPGLDSFVDRPMVGLPRGRSPRGVLCWRRIRGHGAVCFACVLSAVWTWVSGASASSDVSWCAFVVSVVPSVAVCVNVNNCLHVLRGVGLLHRDSLEYSRMAL